MEINIRISDTMNDEARWNESYEHRILRVPASYRDKLQLHVGDFIRLKSKDGVHETFQIAEGFKEDVARNPDTVYVTSRVYEQVLMEDEIPQKDIKLVTGITLGCDPEVFLADRVTGNVLAAYRYLPKNGNVGHDGLLLEFRPNPSVSAAEVCYNLWQLICTARRIFAKKPEGNRIMIVSGSSYNGMTAGFHLHYGLPRGLLGRKPGTYGVAKLMTTVFDYYVGVPSILPEGNRDTVRRTAKHVRYGKPGEYRLNHNTFEFRMPGGVNMAHPVLAQGLMSLGAIVAQDVASRINTCTDCFTNLGEMGSDLDIRMLYPNLPEIGKFYSIICNPDIGAARHYFQFIKDDVRKMVGYDQHAVDVESYFEILDKDIVFSNNVEHNWGGVYNARQQGEMVVL